jgi:hypothetical protein
VKNRSRRMMKVRVAMESPRRLVPGIVSTKEWFVESLNLSLEQKVLRW